MSYDDAAYLAYLILASVVITGLAIAAARHARLSAEQLRNAIRAHRDVRGDDRCYQDDRTLYSVLPEGDTRPLRDNCDHYIASRHDPRITYVSPQRRIEELEAGIRALVPVVHASLVRKSDNPDETNLAPVLDHLFSLLPEASRVPNARE